MGIEEKYKIRYIDGRRYYEFDMTNPLPCLENTTPYLFSYRDILVCAGSWNRMTLGILSELDCRNPKSDEELLSIHYKWSKCVVFSRTQRTNYSPFRDLYLDTNHTSSHSMMNIQCLLEAYGVDLKECFFLYHCHPVAEPEEAKAHFAKETKDEFVQALTLRRFSPASVKAVIDSFQIINGLLRKVSKSFTDFFLLDSLNSFYSLRDKTIAEAKGEFFDQKKIELVERYLSYYEDFLRNRSSYRRLANEKISEAAIICIGSTLRKIISSSPVGVVARGKLYSSFAIAHPTFLKELGSFSDEKGLYFLAGCYFGRKYFFSEPYISATKRINLKGDDLIIEFVYSRDSVSFDDISKFCNKIHIGHLDSKKQLFDITALDYVEVDADRIVSKEKLQLTAETLELIAHELKLAIGERKEMPIDDFRGFWLLPQLEYDWNKYLLMGIIRSYLSETFLLKEVGTIYSDSQFYVSIK